METTVMVGEKPKVTSKIANALGDYSMKENRGVKNYIIETDERRLIVAPAVGHIFNLDQVSEGWDYPVFDVEWKPTFETDDSAGYMKKYYNNLRDQLEKADTYINACDFDLEGSVIGANVIKQITDAPDEKIERMKFSTLTQSDLRDAYDNLESFDRGMTSAGIARHILDYYYGVNVSRALMQAVRENDRYKTLSTGRVQGPTLKVLADKEKEIMEFEPDPYWEITLQHQEFEAKFKDNEKEKPARIWEEDKANQIFSTVKGESKAKVRNIKVNNYKHKPPIPFNLTGLQKEASSQFNLSPKKTQSIAQSLYEDSLISYPRTESQKLPPKLGYKNLLNKLKSQEKYEDLAKKVLKKEQSDNLYTRQGKKEDDAHPAIHPTGKHPSNLSKMEKKVYDLIVKRFFAVFGEAAKRQSLTMTLDVLGYGFEAKSKVTKKRNWFNLYDPYVNVEEADLPEVEEGEKLEVNEFDLKDKETKPPRRYSQSRIVSELEKRNLGTKATRASTIDRLYDRNYIEESPIKVTDLGLTIVNTLEKHAPDVLSEELTRSFEQKMDSIRQGDKTSEEVVSEAQEELKDTLNKFKKDEQEVGAELVKTIDKERKRQRRLGECQECEDGTLKIIKNNGSRFVGCSNYPDCENSFPLPSNGDINSMDEKCEECGNPKIYVSRNSGNDYNMCIYPDCPTKDDW
ncbi:MAG: DNA topoisomerase I, archaeal [Candidatus Nanosalina sp. J07AB43]|nr:MAG: DNA topoisomerase I, archaeal [Candidatus Nanosalina sp. J07AB43]